MNPILVTGGAKGLGAAICRQLTSDGHDVVIHFRDSAREANLLAQAFGSAETIQGDFSTKKGLETFIDSYLKRFPKTKGLVNNVGNYLLASPQDTTPDQWLDLFQTNFFAPVFLTRALLPALREAQGSIVNLGVAGLEGRKGFTHAVAFAATKEALRFYTRSLAKEEAPYHLRVNMVSPGFMENAIDLGDPSLLPMKRAATLAEVARLVATFFHPSTAYVTGQNLEVAGAFGL